MTKKADLPLQSYYEPYGLALQFENKSPATLRSYFQYLTQFQRWLERTLDRTPLLADLTVENTQSVFGNAGDMTTPRSLAPCGR